MLPEKNALILIERQWLGKVPIDGTAGHGKALACRFDHPLRLRISLDGGEVVTARLVAYKRLSLPEEPENYSFTLELLEQPQAASPAVPHVPPEAS